MPWQMVLFHSDRLPGKLKGEEEVVVIGKVYDVNIGYRGKELAHKHGPANVQVRH